MTSDVEINQILERLKQKKPLVDEKLNAYSSLVLFSSSQSKRLMLLESPLVRLVGGELITPNPPPPELQSVMASVLCNLALEEEGRLQMTSCARWRCVSYRHHCVASSLLTLAVTGASSMLKQVALSALLNISISSTCKEKLEVIGAVAPLHSLLHSADQAVAAAAASVMWNLCKHPDICVKLESVHGLLLSRLDTEISLLLLSRAREWRLVFSPDDTGQEIVSSQGLNLEFAMSALANTSGITVLRIQNFLDDTLRSRMEAIRGVAETGPPVGRRPGRHSTKHERALRNTLVKNRLHAKRTSLERVRESSP
jgi:hypothetical protein